MAIVWGPLAGYFAPRASRCRSSSCPVAPQIDLPFLPFVFDIVVGVRRGDDALRDELDAILERARSRRSTRCSTRTECRGSTGGTRSDAMRRGLDRASALVAARARRAASARSATFRTLPRRTPRGPHAGAAGAPCSPATPLPGREVDQPVRRERLRHRQGKRLYSWYNCVGCHFHGGGGIGPPLMDDAVDLRRRSPRTSSTTIVEGRPNGMPSYGGQIPDDQVWQIVAYVRIARAARPPRPRRRAATDHMQAPHVGAERRPSAEPQRRRRAEHPG